MSATFKHPVFCFGSVGIIITDSQAYGHWQQSVCKFTKTWGFLGTEYEQG